MARPRSGEWVEEEFAGIQRLGVTHVVSLLESSEAYELELVSEDAHCAQAGMSFENYPISDRGVPTSVEEFSKFTCRLYHRCTGGDGVVIHCRAGIGRAGMVAGAVMCHGGYTVPDALQTVSAARRVEVPDTLEQVQWLERHYNALTECHEQQQ